MRFNALIILLISLILLSSFVSASILSFNGKTTHSVNGQTYSIQFVGYNSNTHICDFWVWKGTSSSYTDTSERELAPSVGSGQSYNFATFALTLSVSSCGASSASYTLSSGGSSGGSTPSTCSDQCSNHYASWCEGIYVKHCYYDSLGGCWKIGTKTSCTGDYKCQNGECAFSPSCTNECNFAGLQCYQGDVYRCVEEYGCKVYDRVDDCRSGETCINAQCVEAFEAHSFKNCWQNDVWWWNSNNQPQEIYEKCAEGETCSHTECINAACKPNDHLGCYDNRPYWFDSCSNRGESLAACDYRTEKCENGVCIKIQNNECDAGQIKCINEKQYQECKYMATYNAYRWHPTAINCGEGTACINNKCTASKSQCPYECCEDSNIHQTKLCSSNKECVRNKCVEEGKIIDKNAEDNLTDETTIVLRDLPKEDLEVMANELVPTAVESVAELFILFHNSVPQNIAKKKSQCNDPFQCCDQNDPNWEYRPCKKGYTCSEHKCCRNNVCSWEGAIGTVSPSGEKELLGGILQNVKKTIIVTPYLTIKDKVGYTWNCKLLRRPC